MKTIICIMLILLPVLARGAVGCKVVEFEDRTEVVCEGDGKTAPQVAGQPSAVEVPTQEQAAEQSPEAEIAAAPAPPKTPEPAQVKAADPVPAALQSDAPPKALTFSGPNPRSPRPSFADRSSAAMERKRLILEQQPQSN